MAPVTAPENDPSRVERERYREVVEMGQPGDAGAIGGEQGIIADVRRIETDIVKRATEREEVTAVGNGLATDSGGGEAHRPAFGAVGDIELATMDAIVRVEIDLAGEGIEILWAARACAHLQVGHHVAPGRGAVAHPQLAAVDIVVAGEHRQRPGGERHRSDVEVRGMIAGLIDVGKQCRSARQPVADENLGADPGIGRGEHCLAIEAGNVVGVGIVAARIGIPSHMSPDGAAVRNPDLATVGGVVAAEIDLAVGDDRTAIFAHRSDEAQRRAVEGVEPGAVAPVTAPENDPSRVERERYREVVEMGQPGDAGAIGGEQGIIADVRRIETDIVKRATEREEVTAVGNGLATDSGGGEAHRPAFGAVGDIELATMDAIVRVEIDLAGEGIEILWAARACAHLQVGHHVAPGRGAVAHPQLAAVDIVVGGEHRQPAGCERLRSDVEVGRVIRERIDVLEQASAPGGAV